MTFTFRRWLTLGVSLALLAGARESRAQGRATVNGTVLGPAGAAQPNVTLIITNALGVDRRAVSDPSGSFVFGGLQPGVYRLRTDDETFAPFSQDQIVLTGGQSLALEVRLRDRLPPAAPPTQRAGVQGTVIGPDGRPAANVVILMTNAAGLDRRAVSDVNGAYVFGGLPPGAYRLRIDDSGPGVLPFPAADLTFAPGERRQLDVRLQPVPPPPPTSVAPGLAEPAAVATSPTSQARVAAKPEGREKARAKEAKEDGAPAEVTAPGGEFEALPNRWEFEFPKFKRYEGDAGMPWMVGTPLDPYNQNTAKGDFPIAGETIFANLNLQVNSTLNPREVAQGNPLPISQTALNHNFVAGLEIFRGDTVFEPKRWAIRATILGNLNKVSTNDKGTNAHGVEELFLEKRLAVLGPSFDFVSIRVGMQNFNSDFRGYLFADNQLGARLFGNAGSNRSQYNLAYFKMRERDAVSQLHRFASRDQDVFVANYYIQDFGVPGYTFMLNVHSNRDRRASAKAGQTGALNVTYLGFHGDGKVGSWGISHAFYQAFGSDDDSATARRLSGKATPAPVDINARMAALELSKDADWRRYRVSAFFASGDDHTDPGKAKGFDTITDNPNLAGGQFMFWNQQTQKAAGLPDKLLSEKFSLLPNLRSKFSDRANFVNPGLMLVNAGIDLRLSPGLKVVTNVSYLRFANAAVLKALAGSGKGFEDDSIGLDVSVGAKYRPFVNENLFLVVGFSTLSPRGGFATALGSNQRLHSLVAAIQLAY